MEKEIIMIFVLILISIITSKLCLATIREGKFDAYKNKAMLGNTIDSFTVKSKTMCRNYCLNEDRCRGFDLKKSNEEIHCYLKSGYANNPTTELYAD